MSTPATITIHPSPLTVNRKPWTFYRHYDGYPSQVVPELEALAERMHTEGPPTDRDQALAWLNEPNRAYREQHDQRPDYEHADGDWRSSYNYHVFTPEPKQTPDEALADATLRAQLAEEAENSATDQATYLRKRLEEQKELTNQIAQELDATRNSRQGWIKEANFFHTNFLEQKTRAEKAESLAKEWIDEATRLTKELKETQEYRDDWKRAAQTARRREAALRDRIYKSLEPTTDEEGGTDD